MQTGTTKDFKEKNKSRKNSMIFRLPDAWILQAFNLTYGNYEIYQTL